VVIVTNLTAISSIRYSSLGPLAVPRRTAVEVHAMHSVSHVAPIPGYEAE